MFDIVSVGHLCVDSIYLPSRQAPFTVLGGSAAYVSLAARRLGARVSVISKVGGDFPEAYRWWLHEEDVDLSGFTRVESAQSTRYELRYSPDLSERTLVLKGRAPSLTIEDVPSKLKALAIHLAPVAGEISYGLVERLKGSTNILSLDPQGLVRRFDENGFVTHGLVADPEILSLVDIYKSSKAELEKLTGLESNHAVKAIHDYGARIVIVTSGSQGVLLSFEGEQHRVEAIKPDRLVDPTGAGDAFIGGFLYEYVNDSNILRCVYVGAAAASFVVENVGPLSFGDKTQVYQRARELYEKEIIEQ